MMINHIVEQQNKSRIDIEPLLKKVTQDAEREHQELQEAFKLVGWSKLPEALKIEIKDDVLAKVRELKGQYSTCDPFVMKRRQRVSYWVDAFFDNICSLQTAVKALRVGNL